MLTSRPKAKFILGGEFVVRNWSFNLNNTMIGPTTFSNVDLSDFDSPGISRLNDLQVTFNTRVLTDISVGYQLNSRTSVLLNASNIFNILPQWHYKAISPAGAALLSTGVDSRDGTQLSRISNAITFNNRYAYTTYDGSQFSQFGTIFMGQIIYKF